MSALPSINSLISNSKVEASVSPITIGAFPGSGHLLNYSATPTTQLQGSPDSLCSGTSSLLLNNDIELVSDNCTTRFPSQRRSLCDNSLGLLRENSSTASPLKSPSALEAMQAVAKAHLKPCNPPAASKFSSKPPITSSPFKLASLFWNLDTPESIPDSSTPNRSILFSGWGSSPTISENQEGKVFKLPLKIATYNSRFSQEIPLPAVVVRCVEYLDNEGLNEVGLYRIPGSTSLVGQLKARFDTGEDFNLDSEPKPDPHAAATLLKLYIRELPESILTPRVLTEVNHFLVNFKRNENTSQPSVPAHLDNRMLYQVEQIRLLVRNIPDPNYYLLHWLTRHLARVDCNKAINKMDISNLGMIFCPTMGISSLLFRIFVIHSETIFPLPKPPGDDILKRPSPRPYSYSSTRSSISTPSKDSSVSSLACFLKLKGVEKGRLNSPLSKSNLKDSRSDSREAQNEALFENLKALNEAHQLANHKESNLWANDSNMSSLRSRNSIISYQTSTRSRRSLSSDSNFIQVQSPPSTSDEPFEIPDPSSSETAFILNNTVRPKLQRRRNTDVSDSSGAKLRSPGLIKLDYFDGTTMSHALLNLKTRRVNPTINRIPLPSGPSQDIPRVTSKTFLESSDNQPSSNLPKLGRMLLADVDLSKTRANLKPVNQRNN